MNLKEQEGYKEGFGRRKGKWKECNYVTNLKIILKYYIIMSKNKKTCNKFVWGGQRRNCGKILRA